MEHAQITVVEATRSCVAVSTAHLFNNTVNTAFDHCCTCQPIPQAP